MLGGGLLRRRGLLAGRPARVPVRRGAEQIPERPERAGPCPSRRRLRGRRGLGFLRRGRGLFGVAVSGRLDLALGRRALRVDRAALPKVAPRRDLANDQLLLTQPPEVG